MSYQTTQHPGTGLYECVDCRKPLFLTDKNQELSRCPYCKCTDFISADNEDEFYGYRDEADDITVDRFISNYIK